MDESISHNIEEINVIFMCIGTCRKCKGDIDVDDRTVVFYDGDRLFHEECCPVAVSYTHLDVYKRQSHGS